MTCSSRTRSAFGAAALLVLTLTGCNAGPPAESELRPGLVQIMTDLGLATDGAERVADCMLPTLLSDADPASLQRLAEGRHAVLPADERMVSRLEAECIAATS